VFLYEGTFSHEQERLFRLKLRFLTFQTEQRWPRNRKLNWRHTRPLQD